jgi:hypothetical protein
MGSLPVTSSESPSVMLLTSGSLVLETGKNAFELNFFFALFGDDNCVGSE